MSIPARTDLPSGFRRVRLRTRGCDIGAVCSDINNPAGTVLLVHGFTGSKEDFFAILEPLARRGWQVIAIDLPGHFESQLPQPPNYQHAEVVAAVAELCSQFGSAVHLVGHSMGGHICRAVVLDEGARVDSLTLLSSGPGRITGQPALILQAVSALLPHTPVADLWDMKRAADKAAGLPEPAPSILEFLQHRFLASSAYTLLGDARALLTEPDRTSDLEQVATDHHLSILVVYGALEDNWPPQQIQDMAHRLGLTAVEIPACGHSPAVEAPTETAGLLDEFFRTGQVSTGQVSTGQVSTGQVSTGQEQSQRSRLQHGHRRHD